jgi:hypothetical protein
MKTFKSWAEEFCSQGFVGIDQPGIDKMYDAFDAEKVKEYADDYEINPPILRNFRQFSNDMTIGDYIIIGTGKMTQFYVKALAKVSGLYTYKETEPRHIRKVIILEKFDEPIYYPEFNRTARIELISETDWTMTSSALLRTLNAK